MLTPTPDGARWNNDPDLTALRERWSSEPKTVEAMLAQGIMGRDPAAAELIAQLPIAGTVHEGFVKLLTACLGRSPIGFHLAAARALHVLTGEESWCDEVVRVLLGAGFWADRLDAARAVGDFEASPAAIHALSVTLADPEYLVRRQAAETLLRWAGDVPELPQHSPLHALIRSEDSSDWAAAAIELSERATVYGQFH